MSLAVQVDLRQYEGTNGPFVDRLAASYKARKQGRSTFVFDKPADAHHFTERMSKIGFILQIWNPHARA